MTRAEFRPIVATLCAGLDREMAPAQAEVWFQLLERFPAEACQAAVLRFLSEATDSFLPAPGVIVRLVTEALHGVAAGPEAAYAALCRVRREYGSTIHRGDFQARPHLGNELWKLAEGLGGWGAFCNVESVNRAVEFAQVRAAWERMSERTMAALALPSALRPQIRDAGALREAPSRLEAK